MYSASLRHRKIQNGLFATEKQGRIPAEITISNGMPFATHHFIRKGLTEYNKFPHMPAPATGLLYPELLDTV
jgi:hypothetical protein